MTGWPQQLLDRAVITGSGEQLWTRDDLPAAIDWVESRSLGILAIEVYGKVELARGVFQRELEIEPAWEATESWAQYVARSANQAREQLSADQERDAAGPADLYFLIIVPEAAAAPRRGS